MKPLFHVENDPFTNLCEGIKWGQKPETKNKKKKEKEKKRKNKSIVNYNYKLKIKVN